MLSGVGRNLIRLIRADKGKLCGLISTLIFHVGASFLHQIEGFVVLFDKKVMICFCTSLYIVSVAWGQIYYRRSATI